MSPAHAAPGEPAKPLQPEDKPKDKIKPRSSSERSPTVPRSRRIRSASRQSSDNRVPVWPIRSQGIRLPADDPKVPVGPIAFEIPAGTKGKVTITIELNGQGGLEVGNPQPGQIPEPVPDPDGVEEGTWRVVPPAKSLTVFVDITAYNSRAYYVLGDVVTVGKLPWTGNETVLDALQYAGGLTAAAEPKDIRLVRPGRAGKPSKVYTVDLAAIQERGEVTTNYQIFPSDRLIVGRNEIVKKTVEIDRLNAPIQSITGSILQEAFTLRAIQNATADNREELLKEFIDLWAKELSRPDGIKFDEQTLRDALMRKMKLTPAPLQTTPAPR
jgi:hypothetical protein